MDSHSTVTERLVASAGQETLRAPNTLGGESNLVQDELDVLGTKLIVESRPFPLCPSTCRSSFMYLVGEKAAWSKLGRAGWAVLQTTVELLE